MSTEVLGGTVMTVPTPTYVPGPSMLEPEKILTVNVRKSLEDEAAQVVLRINDEKTRIEVLTIGTNMRKTSERNSALLKVRFREIIKDDPNRAELESGIDKMHEAIDGLDPIKLGRLGILQRIFTRNPLAKRIQNIVKGYETGEQKITSVENALDKGSQYLRGDSDELLKLHRSLSEQQNEFAQSAYMLRNVLTGVEALPPPEAGGQAIVDRQFVSEVIQTVSDLSVMYMVNQQFLTTIDITVNNNHALVRNVERLRTLVSLTARSALALQTALLREKGVLAVTKEVKLMLERTLESNAMMVKENAVAIAESSSAPILDIEKVKASYENLQRTMRDIEDIRERTLTESKSALDTIDKVTADLKSTSALKFPTNAASMRPEPPAPPAPQQRVDA